MFDGINNRYIARARHPAHFRQLPRFDTPPNDVATWHHDTNNCELCGTRLTCFSRPHHCRNCGYCVCGNCSSERGYVYFNLPNTPSYHRQFRPGSQYVRICFVCKNLPESLVHKIRELIKPGIRRDDINRCLHMLNVISLRLGKEYIPTSYAIHVKNPSELYSNSADNLIDVILKDPAFRPLLDKSYYQLIDRSLSSYGITHLLNCGVFAAFMTNIEVAYLYSRQNPSFLRSITHSSTLR